MSKPTLVQSLLNRPSQTYSSGIQPPKDYYSNRSEMLRIAASAVLDAGKPSSNGSLTPQKQSETPKRTSPSSSTVSKPSVTTEGATPKKPQTGASTSKSTLSTTSPSSTPQKGNASSTVAPPRHRAGPPNPPPKPRLSYIDYYYPDSDSEGDQSNLDAYFTPNTSPRVSMASSAATIIFPSGSSRKPSRKSLKSAAGDSANGDVDNRSTSARPPFAVPSTRTPSSASERTRALHTLSVSSSLSSTSLDAHSSFAEWLASGEPTLPTTPKPTEVVQQQRRTPTDLPQPPASKTPKTTPKHRTETTIDPNRTTTTPTSTPSRGKHPRPTSTSSDTRSPKPVKAEPVKTKSTVTSVASFQPPPVVELNPTTTPQPKKTLGEALGLSPPETTTPISKGREKEAPPTSLVKPTYHHSSSNGSAKNPTSKHNSSVTTGIPSRPHTFSAFAPVATSAGVATKPPPLTKNPQQQPQPQSTTVTTPPAQMPINLPAPLVSLFNGKQNSSSSTSSPSSSSSAMNKPAQTNHRKKPPPNFMTNSMSALMEEDEEAPFTPRMESRTVEWYGASSFDDHHGSGKGKTLRHTSGSKSRPDMLKRRHSRSLESLSTASGSSPSNSNSNSGSGRTAKQRTMASEVQALSHSMLGDLPSNGTHGYNSLVLPRAPPPLAFSGARKGQLGDGWGRWFSSVGSLVDGKIDLTRTGMAQTTMASVEVIRGLGATRRGPLGNVLNALSGVRRRASSGPGGRERKASEGNGAAIPQIPPQINGSTKVGADETILGFTSHRKPPTYVPSESVLVQVWAIGVDGVDGRLVGVRFGAGLQVPTTYGTAILDSQPVDEPEEMHAASEDVGQETQDEGDTPKKKGLAALGRSLSLRSKKALLARSGSTSVNEEKSITKLPAKDLQRKPSAKKSSTPPTISSPQPHKRSASFSLKRKDTTASTATVKPGDSSLKRGDSASSNASPSKVKQNQADVGYIPGRSFVGRVLECGWSVKDEVVKKGEWVVGLLDVRKCGGLTEFIIVDRHRIHRVPHPRAAVTTTTANPANPNSDSEVPRQIPIPIWTTPPITSQGIINPPTLTLEELALLPLCGLPAYRALRTFMLAFSSVQDGDSTSTAVDLRMGFDINNPTPSSTSTGVHPPRITTDHDQGQRRRALVLRGHDGPGAMAVQMLVQRGWQVSVHVPLGALPVNASYLQEDDFKQSAEDRARAWGADEVIFDDGEAGGGGDSDGRWAAVRVMDSLREEGDVFDAVLDTIGGREVRDAAERLLRSAGGTSMGEGGPGSPYGRQTKKRMSCGQFTTLVGDVPERTIPSAGDLFRAGLRSMRFGSGEGWGGASSGARKGSEDNEGKGPGGKIGYAWISVAHDVDLEGLDVGETLGVVLRMAVEDGIRPWVGEVDGHLLGKPRVVPFERAPRSFVDDGPLSNGGTVVVRIAG